MAQISERYEPLQLIRPINTDHAMFISRGKPVLSFSKKLSRYQNSAILWCLNIIIINVIIINLNVCIVKFIYVYQVTPSLTWIESFIFQDCFYIKLLIVMFIRMFDIQY